jgi:hypothetical protein
VLVVFGPFRVNHRERESGPSLECGRRSRTDTPK